MSPHWLAQAGYVNKDANMVEGTTMDILTMKMKVIKPFSLNK